MSACLPTPPPRSASSASVYVPAPTVGRRANRPVQLSIAEQLFAKGRYSEAAVEWTAEAKLTGGRRVPKLKLKAIEAWLLASQPAAALSVLNGLPLVSLSNDLRIRHRILHAEIQRQLGQSGEGLRLLPTIGQAAQYDQEDHHAVVAAHLLADLGRMDESLEMRAALLARLDHEEEPLRAERQVAALWSSIGRLSYGQLDSRRERVSPALAGWLEMASLLKRSDLDGPQKNRALADWQLLYPEHPAIDYLPILTVERQKVIQGSQIQPRRAIYRLPTDVALLVPLTGRLAAVGQAIRDGFEAGQDFANHAWNLRVYDTASGELAINAYRTAVADNVDVIVGPLDKRAVLTLTRRSDPNIPVLMLNRLPPGVASPPNLFQFALTPEDDAYSLAQLMLEENRMRIAVLASENDYGERILNAFSNTYIAEGGHIVAVQRYAPGSNNLRGQVGRLLRSESAEPLWRDLRRNDPMAQEGEMYAERVASDQRIHAVLVIGNPRDARLIRPMLKFHNAVDLPAYGAAGIWAGQPEPKEDRDLDGVKFCTLPWLLPDSNTAALRELAQNDHPGLDRHPPKLVAFGADAQMLAGQLQQMSDDPEHRLAGHTGLLWLGSDGRIRRELVCGEFKRGVARRLPGRSNETEMGDLNLLPVNLGN